MWQRSESVITEVSPRTSINHVSLGRRGELGRGEKEGGRETVYSTTSLKSNQTIMLMAWVPRASELGFVVGGGGQRRSALLEVGWRTWRRSWPPLSYAECSVRVPFIASN